MRLGCQSKATPRECLPARLPPAVSRPLLLSPPPCRRRLLPTWLLRPAALCVLPAPLAPGDHRNCRDLLFSLLLLCAVNLLLHPFFSCTELAPTLSTPSRCSFTCSCKCHASSLLRTLLCSFSPLVKLRLWHPSLLTGAHRMGSDGNSCVNGRQVGHSSQRQGRWPAVARSHRLPPPLSVKQGGHHRCREGLSVAVGRAPGRPLPRLCYRRGGGRLPVGQRGQRALAAGGHLLLS